MYTDFILNKSVEKQVSLSLTALLYIKATHIVFSFFGFLFENLVKSRVLPIVTYSTHFSEGETFIALKKFTPKSGLSKRFRVFGDAKKVGGGPTKHETHHTPIAAF